MSSHILALPSYAEWGLLSHFKTEYTPPTPEYTLSSRRCQYRLRILTSLAFAIILSISFFLAIPFPSFLVDVSVNSSWSMALVPS